MRFRTFALAAAMLAALPAQAGADGTLEGRSVTLRVLTYDIPEDPWFEGQGQTVSVGAMVEFGLELEGAQNGLDVVPVQVNVSARRIELSYHATPPGAFVPARFNGYELQFDTDCALFDAASLDREKTTLPLDDNALTMRGGSLFINVQGLEYDQSSRIAVDLSVADCPMS